MNKYMEINIHEGVLTIAGERKEQKEGKDKEYWR
jgi:HSP20 family molecular chaperone IbpA